MKVIDPYVVCETEMCRELILEQIEKIGRVCYKSEDRITPESAASFVKRILENGHESVIEHVSITMRVICDRGVSHEIVRHRIASYSQESTRYCNYSTDKFDNQVVFIRPLFFADQSELLRKWETAMKCAEEAYLSLIKGGASAQEARSVLPNSLKTEIVMTMNLREWRHFLKLRTSSAAHPQMRQVAMMIRALFREKLPEIFGDL